MASKTIYFVLLIVALSLVVENTEAGWKFWKKKKDEPTTIAPPGAAIDGQLPAGSPAINANAGTGPAAAGNAKPAALPTGGQNAYPGGQNGHPGGQNPAQPGSPSSVGQNANNRQGGQAAAGTQPGSPSTGTRGALAGAANPGLAIGVGNTGTNIRNNARPQRPNPGTEVGLDISGPRPAAARPGSGGANGQGYRDWAADLTGAGNDARQPPKLPAQGPVLSPSGGQQRPQPAAGTRPSSPVNPAAGQTPYSNNNNNNRQSPPVPGSRPGSPSTSMTAGLPNNNNQQPGQVAPGQGNINKPATPNSPATGSSGGSQVSTLHVGSLNPGQNPRAGSPASPTGGKSWADVAATGGNSRPASPTPAPRPGSSLQPGQPQFGQNRPGMAPASGGRPANAGGSSSSSSSSGSLAPGLAAGSAVAGAAAIGAAAAGSKKVYSSNPTYSKGRTVTDEDLEKLAEALFIKDTNNANRHITLNLQKQTTGSNSADLAPQPLLTVNAQALQIPTIQKVLTIYDNYNPDVKVNEYISPAQRNEESLLVDTFLSTNVMSAAMRFLADKGFVRKDYYDYKDTLRKLWFNLYSRGDGKIGSTGFEHVFLTELKLGTEVLGLHNWIYFNAEEVARRADYLGYLKKVDLGDKASIVQIHAKYQNVDKPATTMFIGTSPELEMALYTVCFFARPDRTCPVSLGGTKFNIQTYKFKYRGNDLIGAAYPVI